MRNRSMHARELSESVAKASLGMVPSTGIGLMVVRIKGLLLGFHRIDS